MRSPEFEAMIGPAKLYPQLWRLMLGLLVILFCYFGVIAMQAVALFGFVGPLEYFGWIQRLSRPTEPVPTLLVLATFLGMLIGPIMAAAACHARGPGTLFGPADETFRGITTVFAITVPLYALFLGAASLFETPVPNLPWEIWLRWLPFALPLVAVQITAEELIFRGYLQQQLAARFRSRIIWMGLPSLLFASLHYNPEIGHVVWLIVLATFVFALVAADLTEKTGSLGAAIGLHFVNNVYALTVISVPDTITGLSRWVTPFDTSDVQAMGISIGLNILFLVALWRILRWALDR